MLRTFDGLALRQMRTRRLRVLLTAFGVVLGVGMVFGVLLLVGTIRQTFDELITSAWGRTDLIAMSSSGGQIPERSFAEARAVPGVENVAPMIGGVFRRLDARGDPVRGNGGQMYVAGFDFRNPPYDFHYVAGGPPRAGTEVVVDRGWASKHGVHVGQMLGVAASTGRARVRVAGVFEFAKGLSYGDYGFAGMPLRSARSLLAMPAGYMQLSFQASDRSRVPALRARLEHVLGAGVDVKTPQGYSDQVAKQLQGFNVVLYFFSGVALFVGGFLILNSFNMTVAQRMRELGMLRTLGATRGMIVRSVLVEALAIGAVGTVLGLGLGLALSGGLLVLIKGLGVPAGSLVVTPGPVVSAIVVGLLVTALGALYPARRAGRIAPIRAVLGDAHVRRAPTARRALVGLVLFVPGVVLGGRFWLSDAAQRSSLLAVLGLLLTMAMFVGMALAAPYLIMPVVRALTVPLRRLAPTGGRLAGDATRSDPGRTAATAIALTIGLSVVVVNSSLSQSFLGTINDQITAAYQRDFTVQAQGASLERGGQTIAPKVRARIAALPGAGVVTPVRSALMELPGSSSTQPGLVMAVDPRAWGRVDRTEITGATRAAALAGVEAGGVLVSPGYARAAHLHVGSRVRLRGPAGTQPARVAGELQANVAGLNESMELSLATMRDVYGVTADSQIVVRASSGAARAGLGHRIDALLRREYPSLESLSTAEVRHQIEQEVNRQFDLFNAILVIAIVVSLLGVINTLAMSVLERTREIGVLRALGSSRWQVRATMLDESLLITISGAVAGVVLGAIIGFAWVQSLGTFMPGISFRFPTGAVLLTGLAAVVLGVLAAILPAQRAARLDPMRAISYE